MAVFSPPDCQITDSGLSYIKGMDICYFMRYAVISILLCLSSGGTMSY